MLKAHMDAVERSLVQTSLIPASSGHSLHKGTPREAFIRQFLDGHLSPSVAIGTGEIIDATSLPGTPRNQFDIVIYKKNYPKIDFGGGINGFLIESVVATIEVKSILDQSAVNQSVKAARSAKSLVPNVVKSFSAGWAPPSVLNFVVSYQGPASMKTVYGLVDNAHKSLSIPMPNWNQSNRLSVPGTALDGLFVLEKGFIKLDNSPLTLNTSALSGTHIVCDTQTGNLLMLFLALQEACNNIDGSWLNPVPYIKSVQFPGVMII